MYIVIYKWILDFDSEFTQVRTQIEFRIQIFVLVAILCDGQLHIHSISRAIPGAS